MVKNRAFASGVDTLCLICNRKRVRAWRAAGKRDSAKESRLYNAKYPEKAKERSARYRATSPERARANCKACQHSRRDRNVSWEKELTTLVVKEASLLCELRKEYTGITWHIDHIIPLKGNVVSGLHVWNNIQVIPAIDNLRKSNSWTGY